MKLGNDRFRAMAALLAALGSQACEGTGDSDSPTLVQLALTEVPTGVRCVVLEALPEGSTKATVKNTAVVAGLPATIAMGGLAPGRTAFTARAFTNTCPPPASAVPVYVSTPVVAVINVGATTDLPLVLYKGGSVNGTIDWQDGVPECPMGQVTCGSSCANVQTDSLNCGTCGNACGAGASCQAGRCTYSVTLPLDETRSGTVKTDGSTQPNGFYTGEGDSAGSIGQRSFLRFDVSSLPANAVPTRAILSVNMSLCQRNGVGTAISSNFPTELGPVVVERVRFGTLDVGDYAAAPASAGQITVLSDAVIGTHTANILIGWVAADAPSGSLELRLRHNLADTFPSNNTRDLCGFNGPKPTLQIEYTLL